MKQQYGRILLIFSLGLSVANVNFAEVDKEQELMSQQSSFADEQTNELLRQIGVLFELNCPIPGQILELDLEEIEDPELAAYLEKVILTLGSEPGINDSTKIIHEEFNKVFAEADQFQKHEHFLNLCLLAIKKDPNSPNSVVGEDFFQHIEKLFQPNDQKKIKLIVEQFIREEKIIRKIATTKNRKQRSKKIIENFPENRRNGATELLDEFMMMNSFRENIQGSERSTESKAFDI